MNLLPHTDPTLRLLHVEESFVVVDKPAGLLAVPGRGEAGQQHLAGRVQAALPDALVVHRLDMATSGLMLFARGADMQRRLSAMFEARAIDKQYIAVVHGDIAGDSGVIDLPIGADWPNRPRQRVDHEQGKPACTRWQVLQRQVDSGAAGAATGTRLALQPVTGRTHQLRVHLAAIGHSIVGDALYGPAYLPRDVSSDDPRDDRNDDRSDDPSDDPSDVPLNSPTDRPRPRLLLHATMLGFAHPLHGGDCRFDSPAPF